MQNIVRFFVDRWQFSLVLFAMLVALGASAMVSIPKSEDPTVRFPIAGVTVVLPGADAEQIEKLIVVPLEQAFNRIEDVKEVRSSATSGVGSVTVEFTYGADPERKFDELVRELNVARPDFPPGVVDVRTFKANTANANVVVLALVSETAPARQMEAAARDLRDMLERAGGVQQSQIWGAPESEVRVSLDLDRLSTFQLSPLAVVDALQREGADVPIGAVQSGGRRFNVTATGPFDSLDEIRSTVLRSASGSTLTVGDIAKVEWDNDEPRHFTRFNGERAVLVSAKGKLGVDVFVVRNNLYKQIEAYRSSLPEGIRLELGFDQSKTVAHRLTNLGRDFGIAVLLVLLTLLPLGIRAAIVVMMAIPLSLAIGVFWIGQLGYTMNQLSISGFVIALGLLVDDSIVVTENIARHLRNGLPRREAAIAGVSEINVAVIGCTATLIFAFLPLIALPEGAGDFTRSLPVAVLTTIIASLVVSLTIIPFLAGQLLPRDGHGKSNIFLDTVMGGIHAIYRPILRLALRFPVSTVVVSLAVALSSFALVPRLGFSLFPENDSPYFLVDVELPQGVSIDETDKAVRYVESVLASREDIAFRFANSGSSNPQVYYNVFETIGVPDFGQVYGAFKHWHPDEGPALVSEIRAELAKYPAAKLTFRRFENGPPVEAPIAVRIWGKDNDTLSQIAGDVELILRDTTGTRDVSNPAAARQVDLELNIDTAKAALLGIPPGAIDQTLRVAVGGATVAQVRDPTGEAYPIRVRMDAGSPPDADALQRMYLWNGQGGGVPLSEIASVEFSSGPTAVNRVQQERVVTVLSYVLPDYLAADVTADVASKINAINLPPGYRITFGGQAEAASESFSGLGAAVLIALFGVLAVLLLEFGSFAQMAVVAFVIPFGVMGGFVALYIAQYPLSFIAMIGFIALIGIEIKNSILLVDFANRLRREGVPLREAVVQAGEVRFLPVLLTSATAIGGMIPLVLEQSPLVSPLAVVIIGGLVSSTILARIVTPAMYMLLTPKDLAEPKHSEEPADAY
ncbi:efflux RND transporter permease subunit [Hyphomonas sp.]|uniref:efflux RND transporter permease subunit n=1 Tax=Hyphomonas sp. TaxID=87 RepID=UPI000AA498CA|nr:efflux RND transporter permease subunit [Hyphomonas sp.]